MLHLLPEIERITTEDGAMTTREHPGRDRSTSPGVKQKHRSPVRGSQTAPARGSQTARNPSSQTARSAWGERQVREDVLTAIRTECKALQSAMEEGFRKLEVSQKEQKESLQQLINTATLAASGNRQMENSIGSSAASALALFTNYEPANQLLGRPRLPEISGSNDGVPATLPGASDELQMRNRTVSGDSLHTSEKDAHRHGGAANFKQKADRMAERGNHGAEELAEASGWGKKIPDDSQKESLFHKGVDICRFGQRDQLLNLVKSRPFELSISIVIFANAIFMGLKANLELNSVKDGHIENSLWLKLLERFFTLAFTLEWIFRFLAYQKWFFRVEDWKWHVFDTFLVGVSVIELVVEVSGGETESAGTLVLRVLRMIRLVRLLKIVRYISAFRELRLMIYGLFSSLRSLFWSFVLLTLVVYIFAIVFVQAAIAFISRNDFMGDPPELKDDFIEFFGSTQVSMRTLFVSISGGADWVAFVYLLEQAEITYSLLFLLYIGVVFHGVLHVIASIFVDSAMQTSKVEKDQLIREEMSAKDSYMSLIKTLLEEADNDNSGTISWEEFQAKLDDPSMQEFLKNIELDKTEARGLFKLLDVDESDEVPIDEFVTGCFRLKGSGKSLDLASIMHENKKMMRVFMQFMSYTQEQFELLLDSLSRAGFAHRLE